jgi:hypothetical protein
MLLYCALASGAAAPDAELRVASNKTDTATVIASVVLRTVRRIAAPAKRPSVSFTEVLFMTNLSCCFTTFAYSEIDSSN